MKKILPIVIILTFSNLCFSQKPTIEQSSPFEKLLTAIQKDSSELFKSAFSSRIITDENSNTKTWDDRLEIAQERFTDKFGEFELSDFTYNFNKKESKLVIFYKTEEIVQMKVIKENGNWKLDEH